MSTSQQNWRWVTNYRELKATQELATSIKLTSCHVKLELEIGIGIGIGIGRRSGNGVRCCDSKQQPQQQQQFYGPASSVLPIRWCECTSDAILKLCADIPHPRILWQARLIFHTIVIIIIIIIFPTHTRCFPSLPVSSFSFPILRPLHRPSAHFQWAGQSPSTQNKTKTTSKQFHRHWSSFFVERNIVMLTNPFDGLSWGKWGCLFGTFVFQHSPTSTD